MNWQKINKIVKKREQEKANKIDSLYSKYSDFQILSGKPMNFENFKLCIYFAKLAGTYSEFKNKIEKNYNLYLFLTGKDLTSL
jgi:hypothetical protein